MPFAVGGGPGGTAQHREISVALVLLKALGATLISGDQDRTSQLGETILLRPILYLKVGWKIFYHHSVNVILAIGLEMAQRKASAVVLRLGAELFKEVSRRGILALPLDRPCPVNLKWAGMWARFAPHNGPVDPRQVNVRNIFEERFKAGKADLCGYVAQSIETRIARRPVAERRPLLPRFRTH